MKSSNRRPSVKRRNILSTIIYSWTWAENSNNIVDYAGHLRLATPSHDEQWGKGYTGYTLKIAMGQIGRELSSRLPPPRRRISSTSDSTPFSFNFSAIFMIGTFSPRKHPTSGFQRTNRFRAVVASNENVGYLSKLGTNMRLAANHVGWSAFADQRGLISHKRGRGQRAQDIHICSENCLWWTSYSLMAQVWPARRCWE